MNKRKYKYTGNSSFESAYNDCKLVDESIVDEESFQDADSGLVFYYMDRILEALEKQVPMKLDSEAKARGEYFCNNCYEPIPRLDTRYCPYCGQKIDLE